MMFEEQLQFGKVGESKIAQWLIERGFSILPIYEKEIDEGKGPVLYTEGGVIVAPDMLIYKKNGEMMMIEAKTKTSFTWHRKTKQWVTGINARHFDEYLKVMANFPWPIRILFLHLDAQGAKDTPPELIGKSPVGLFGNDLAYLSQHIHHRWQNGSPMVYWALGDLKRYARLEDLGVKPEVQDE